MRQLKALMDRHEEALRLEDMFHARTALCFAKKGTALDEILFLKPEKPLPTQAEMNAKIETMMAMFGADV